MFFVCFVFILVWYQGNAGLTKRIGSDSAAFWKRFVEFKSSLNVLWDLSVTFLTMDQFLRILTELIQVI